jgi:hypothetical protein
MKTFRSCFLRLSATSPGVVLLVLARWISGKRSQSISAVVEIVAPGSHMGISSVVGMHAVCSAMKPGRWSLGLSAKDLPQLSSHVSRGWPRLPARAWFRTLIVHPESATLVYAGDNYSVRETLFLCSRSRGGRGHCAGSQTEQPLEIEARFIGDFQLGNGPLRWEERSLTGTVSHHAIVFGEEQKRFSAMVGSPSADDPHLAYQSELFLFGRKFLSSGRDRQGKGNQTYSSCRIDEGVGGGTNQLPTADDFLCGFDA